MSGRTKGPWYLERVSGQRGCTHQIQGDRSGISSVIIADAPIGFDHFPKSPHATWDHQEANFAFIVHGAEVE